MHVAQRSTIPFTIHGITRGTILGITRGIVEITSTVAVGEITFTTPTISTEIATDTAIAGAVAVGAVALTTIVLQAGAAVTAIP